MKMSKGEKIYQLCNYAFISLLTMVMLYPMWHVLMFSVSDEKRTIGAGLFFHPEGFSLKAYSIVLNNPFITSAYKNTIIVVIGATALNILLSFLMAYPLTKDQLRGKTFITFFIFFTMLFSGGIIPLYIVVKTLGMLNSLWSLIIPLAVSPYYIFILRNFLKTIPESLTESAKLDGANELVILFRIIIPLSKPVLAVLALMYGVNHWNSWFHCVMFNNSLSRFTLQPIVREIIFVMQADEFFAHDPDLMLGKSNMSEVVKMATVMVATIPIVMVYPFLQKYFIKGMMIGAIKG